MVDAALRIPLEQTGFRWQGTHVAMWLEGVRYRGRRPHRRDAHEERVDDLRRVLDASRSGATDCGTFDVVHGLLDTVPRPMRR